MSLLALWAILIYVGYAGMVFFAQRGMLYPAPQSRGSVQDAPLPRDAERILLYPSGGITQAWLLPPSLPSEFGPHRYPVLLFAHGNGERIEDWGNAFAPLRNAGVGILLVEYPGYGYSEGKPSQQSITETMVLAYDALVTRDDIDPDRIAGMGRSLGGGAIMALSQQRTLRQVILQSTFTGVRPFARQFLLPGFLVRDPYDNVRAVEQYDGPVLILHGEQDPMIPFDHARTLAAATPRSTLVPLACQHNDCPPDWGEYWAHIRAFLEEYGSLEATPPVPEEP